MLLRKFSDIFIGLALIACLLALVGFAVPLEFPNHFNFDESIELVRVHLLKRNYIFYNEVWSDHPLGLPRIFEFFSTFIKISLPSARLIVLALSALNLLFFYTILRFDCNKISATIAVLILITTYQYIPLSALVINEVPSLTLVIVSLLFMYLYARDINKLKYFYLVLSALFFVWSLEVKLSGLVALPSLIAIGFLRHQQWSKTLKDAGIWVITFLLSFYFFSATILPFSFYHLIQLHSGASEQFASSDPSLTLSTLLATGLKQDTVYALLIIFAMGSLWFYRGKIQFLPPFLLLSFNLLRFYKALPVWPNYYVHLALPSAWIIGLTLNRLNLQSLGHEIRDRGINSKELALPLFMIFSIFTQMSFNLFKIATVRQPKRYQNSALVRLNLTAKTFQPNPVEEFLQREQGSQKIILTDNPYFIYKLELNTPPETAILSRKRIIAEGIDGEFILKVIQKRKPDFVLLDRFPDRFMKSKALSGFLQENYSEYLLKNSRSRFFIAKSSSLSQNSPPQ